MYLTKNVTLKVWLIFLVIPAYCQVSAQDNSKLKTTDHQLLEWLEGLYDVHAAFTRDSILINAESLQLIRDSTYRAEFYPDHYEWEQALTYISNEELKKAFWYFINLYPQSKTNRELVVKSLLLYDHLFQVEKILITSFYTYVIADPEIANIVEGYPQVARPHILDQKESILEELVFIIEKYRQVRERTRNAELTNPD